MKTRKTLPSLDLLDTYLDYNPETGILSWKESANHNGNAEAGSEAGWTTSYGYRMVGINYTNYMAHRIAWKLHYQEDPPKLLDHIDRVKVNNRISNLRVATYRINAINKDIQSNNTSGCKGVNKKGNRWMARISTGGHRIVIGRYDTKREAIEARLAAEQKYYH